MTAGGRLRSGIDAATRQPILFVAALALAARVVVAVVSFLVNDRGVVPDELQYLGLAASVANGNGADAWYPGYGAALFESTWTFMAPLATLAEVTTSRLPAQLWVAAWGVAVAAGTAALAVRLGVSRRLALGAGLVVALMPSQVLWSSIVLRESMIWTALLVIGLACAHLVAGSSWRWFAVPALALVALAHLRSHVAAAAAVALLVASWIGPRTGRVVRGAALTGVAVLCPMISGLGPLGLGLIFDAQDNLTATQARLSLDAESGVDSAEVIVDSEGRPRRCSNDADDGSTDAGAEALADREPMFIDSDGTRVEVICSPNGVLLVLEPGGSLLARGMRGLGTNLFEPLPWSPASSRMSRLASLENPLWYVLYVGAAVGVVEALRRRILATAFPAMVAITTIGSSSLAQGNVGTAFRHRSEVLWVLAVFAALALDRRSRRRYESAAADA